MPYSQVITYDNDTNTALSYDSTLITLDDPHLKLEGSPYSTTNPVAVTLNAISLSQLASFAEVASTPANTAIRYQLVLNNTTYWYSTVLGAWTTADDTYATTNDAATINSNAGGLFSDLNIITPQFLRLRIFLHTSDTVATPVLTSNTVGYRLPSTSHTAINQCTISATLGDLVSTPTPPTTAKPAMLHVSAPYGFMHGTNLIQPFSKSFAFDTTTGDVTAAVIETETPGVALKFSVTYYDGESVKTTQFANAIVPNQPTINLSNLTSVVPYDFG